jgi:DNA invertase Pin-like site-specific DNA recombinase
MTDKDRHKAPAKGRERREVYRAGSAPDATEPALPASFEVLQSVVDHTAVVAAVLASTKAVFYGRASRDRTGQRSSVTTQEGKFDALIAREDWEDCGRFIDNDLSGSKRNVVRPEFERLCKVIERGELKPELVVAYDVSRLMRNRRDKIRLEQLIDSGVHLYDIRYGIDTRDKTGLIMFSIMAEMAIDRAQELADYQRDYHERRRVSGRPSRSSRGFGYTQVRNDEGKVTGFELNTTAEDAVRWAVKELRAGASLRSIVVAWNDVDSSHHVKPLRAKQFSDSTVRNIVCSARIAGCVEHASRDEHGNVVSVSFVPNTDWTLPAIVTIEDVLALRERFKMNQFLYESGSGVGRPAKYLLSGIPTCGICTRRMYSTPTYKGKRAYACQYCARDRRVGPSIRAEVLEEFIVGATFERLRSGALAGLLSKAATSEGIEETAKQIAAEEEELRRFEKLVEGGESVSPERYLSYTGAKETRISMLKTKLAEDLEEAPESMIPTLPDDIVENIEAYWEEADLHWKRRLIRLCFERVVINRSPVKGRRTPAQSLERVDITPRGLAAGDVVADGPVADGSVGDADEAAAA